MVSPDFYLPFQCEVLKWGFDLSNDNSAEGKDGVLLSFDIRLWFAVDFKFSPNFFSLEFTDSDFCCRENVEIVFSLATKCFLIVASFSCCLFFCFNIFNKCYHLLGCLVLHVVNKAKSFHGAGTVLFTIRHNEDCCLCLGQVGWGWSTHRNAEHVLGLSYLQFS